MKHKRVYEDCKNLVSCGEAVFDYKNYKYEVYLDSFGCDLQVGCHSVKTVSGPTDVYVYLGGRTVYSFSDEYPDDEYMINGHWVKLVSELRRYEFDRRLGESLHVINGTLLELCRREAARNRKIMNKYCEICLSLAKKKGKKVPEGFCRYEFEKAIDGHMVKVLMAEDSFEDSVELLFDDERVFLFYFNSSRIGWIHDDKGDYTPGEWEKILEQLAEEI